MKKIILGIFALFISTSANAFLGRGYNIEQLSTKANVIFMGEVIKVETRQSSSNPADLPYIQIYFKVFETLKGGVPAVYSFKQFAPKVGKQFQLLGMDRHAYVPGQKLVMFLGSPSSHTGFSAPEDFQLFGLQSKSDRQNDLDQAIVFNKQFGDKVGDGLFQHLEKANTKQVVEKIQKAPQSNGVTFKDFRNLIQASIR
jgi:hypothetical protein